MSSLAFVSISAFFVSPATHQRQRAPLVLCTAKPKEPTRGKQAQSKRPGKRRYRYWSSLSNTLSELYEYLNGSQTLPTSAELQKAGRFDLDSALRRHGWGRISQATGLPLASVARPRSLHLVACTPSPPLRMRPYMYWRDFEHLQDALRPHIRNNGMPTARELIGANQSEIIRAIRMHGGWKAVAHRMGVRPSSKPDWSDLSVVQEEVRQAMQRANASDNELPNVSIIRNFGTRGLLHAIRTHHGGVTQIVRTMYKPKVKYQPVSRKPRGYWTKERLESEVIQCAKSLSDERTNEPLYMPTASQFKRIGRSDVLSAIDRAGGVRRVAEACGLRSKRKVQSQASDRGT